MSIKKRIIELRKNSKLSQEAVAELTGIHKNTLSNWERGLSCPDAKNILILCKLYEVSPNYLLDYSDAPTEISEMLRDMIVAGDFDFLLEAMAWDPAQRRELSVLVKILQQAPPEVMEGLNVFLSSCGFADMASFGMRVNKTIGTEVKRRKSDKKDEK